MKLILFLAVTASVTWGGVYLNHQHTVSMSQSESLRAENAALRTENESLKNSFEAVINEAQRVIRVYKRQEMRCREQYL